MRRISTNAGLLANWPGLGDTAGRRDGTHMLGLAQAPLGTGQAASGEVLSFQEAWWLVPDNPLGLLMKEQGCQVWWSHLEGNCLYQ